MGRVFTIEQVELGHIPNPEDFAPAAQYLLKELPHLPHFAGALILGSVTTGSATQRSDLDVFIHFWAPPSETLSSAIAPYKKLFTDIEADTNIAVEANLYDTWRLLSGSHTVDEFFRTNLEAVDERWVVGDNPVPSIDVSHVTPGQSYQRYAISKLEKFGVKAPTYFDAKTMQRALELPTALGRKSLAMLQNPEKVLKHDFITGPRSTVLKALAQSDLPDACKALIDRQSKFDYGYSDVLKNTLAKDMKTEQYGMWVEANYPPVVSNALDITEMLMDFVLNAVGDEL